MVPYPGLRPFLPTESDWFFGRRRDIGALAEMWQANRLTVASGPVGCGKTSLLLAGILPLVRSGHWQVLPPGQLGYGATFPSAALPEHNPYTLALLRSWSPDEALASLTGLTVSEFVHRQVQRHEGLLLAAVDHLEDLRVDSGPRRWHRRYFLRELAAALRDHPCLHLLLVVREDSVGLVPEELGHGARYRVTPLTRERAIEAVRKPFEKTGREFTYEAAEKLVGDLQPGLLAATSGHQDYEVAGRVEPSLLQVVCTRLWESLPADVDTVTVREVRVHGDADTALAAHLSRVIAAVADEHDLTAKRLRPWLLATFVTPHETRKSAYEVGPSTAGLPNAVVRALTDWHLLAAETYDGSRRYELLSPRLIEPLRQAADERPTPAEPARFLRAAEQALTRGELDLAREYAGHALRASPDPGFPIRAEASSLLGNVAHERDKPIDAESWYREAAFLFEAMGDTLAVARLLAAVGRTLAAQERYRDAVTELRSAVDRLPNDPLIQTDLARALWQLGDGRAAVAVLTDVLGVDGGNVEALRVRGEILAYLGDARKAMLDLDRITWHSSPSVHAARGLALAELGDRSAARQEIDGVVDDSTRDGTVLLYAARVRVLSGDEVAAKALASRAVDASDPALPPSRRGYALELAQPGICQLRSG